MQVLTVETFPALATLLRMAKRYQIEKPCQDIVAHIHAEWPASLAQHDTKEAKLKAERTKRFGHLVSDVKSQSDVPDDSLNARQPQYFNPNPLPKHLMPPMPPMHPLPRIPPMQGRGMHPVGNQNLPQPGMSLKMLFEGGMYRAPGAGNFTMGGAVRGGGGFAYAPPAHHVPFNPVAGPSNAPAPAPAPSPPPPPALGAGNL